MRLIINKENEYIASVREINIRLENGGNLISDLGNITAVLKKRLRYYWIGFYFLENKRLVLGPFQGTPACVFLDLSKGVCAECVAKKKTLIVADVYDFSEHVACDPNSKSEIVVPLFDKSGKLRGVLDIDSDKKNCFDQIDEKWLLKIENIIKKIW